MARSARWRRNGPNKGNPTKSHTITRKRRGGGAGLGAAIFNMQGQLTIVDSTLTANTALGGADNVTDHAKGIGGGLFNLSGSFSATASTFFANTAAYDGASIYNLVYDGATARTAQATLTDTIVAGGQRPFQLTSDRPAAVAGGTNLGTAAADVSQFDLVRTMRTVGTGSIFGSPHGRRRSQQAAARGRAPLGRCPQSLLAAPIADGRKGAVDND